MARRKQGLDMAALAQAIEAADHEYDRFGLLVEEARSDFGFVPTHDQAITLLRLSRITADLAEALMLRLRAIEDRTTLEKRLRAEIGASVE